MKKKPNTNIDIELQISIIDDGIEEKPVNAFYRMPWGWITVAFIILFVLNVEWGKAILSLSAYYSVGSVTVWGTFFSYIFFIWKVVDKSDREGGYVGNSYGYLGM